LERLAIQGQSLLQTIKGSKLNIAEALGTLHLSVLNNSDTGNLAALKELSDGFDSRIVREVAEMSSIRWFGGECLRGTLADRVACRIVRDLVMLGCD
jgi:hypothetical protein